MFFFSFDNDDLQRRWQAMQQSFMISAKIHNPDPNAMYWNIEDAIVCYSGAEDRADLSDTAVQIEDLPVTWHPEDLPDDLDKTSVFLYRRAIDEENMVLG